MMKRVFIAILCALFLTKPSYSNNWPSWDAFKKNFISTDGRVIDLSSSQSLTTSEGQSYAMFFALVADDRATFELLLRWTENNLAKGDLSQNLPAWKWGKNTSGTWQIIDTNSASDADMWIAYSLLEASRLWNNPSYALRGKALLQRITLEEVVNVPDLGNMILPGKHGFVQKDYWIFNPSYLPLQLLKRFERENPVWREIYRNSLELLVDTSPKGFAPDWVVWFSKKGWGSYPNAPDKGSYDAIRVYLWAGMLANTTQENDNFMLHFQPMVNATITNTYPPEYTNTAKASYTGTGPVGFSSAMAPLMIHTPELVTQLARIHSFSFESKEYYNSVLTLFGSGWIEHRFHFDASGQLVPELLTQSHETIEQLLIESNQDGAI